MIHKIRLQGLEVFAYHGVLQHEQDFGQTFLIDANLKIEAGDADSIETTVSYAAIAARIVHVATTTRFNLIESLARELVNRVLEMDERILKCKITVHKPQAPMPQTFKDVSVSFARTRGED